MTDPLIYDDDSPHGRHATDQEITDLLGEMVTADGTSILDIWRDSQQED